METLMIEPTDFTPKVIFSAEDHMFEISGFSRPEDVPFFYLPLIDWMNKYVAERIAGRHDKYQFSETLRFVFRLTYFNSSSAKMILQILEQLKVLESENIPVQIEWYYDDGDDQILEDGEDLASAVDMNFRFFAIES
jgi:hypothetical protein